MKLLSLAWLLTLPQQPTDTVTFTDPYIGLSFNHSKAWTPLKKVKDISRFAVPIDGTTETAELEIIRSNYHGNKETWRTIQINANETMHRDVARQWEQTVINVPLLCTQINFTDRGESKSTLTGLYYTKTPIKMLFRLTAPAGAYEKVRAEFMSDLESLRTVSGAAPVEDDPNFEFPDTKKPQLAPDKPKVIDVPKEAPARTFKDQVSVPIVVSTKPVTLKLPAGWSASPAKDGVLTVQSPKTAAGAAPVTVKIEIHSSLDSDRPAVALNKAASQELDEFLPGVRREDTDPTPNATGCAISTVWRTGKDSKGPLVTFHASGEQGDFYFLASYRVQSLADSKSARKLIAVLLDEINLSTGTP